MNLVQGFSLQDNRNRTLLYLQARAFISSSTPNDCAQKFWSWRAVPPWQKYFLAKVKNAGFLCFTSPTMFFSVGIVFYPTFRVPIGYWNDIEQVIEELPLCCYKELPCVALIWRTGTRKSIESLHQVKFVFYMRGLFGNLQRAPGNWLGLIKRDSEACFLVLDTFKDSYSHSESFPDGTSSG
jgi:hypothetical protein